MDGDGNIKNVGITWLLLLVVCSACGGRQPAEPGEGPLQIAVSILPQVEIVSRVCGDSARVKAVIRPGDSPASFEPTPRDLAEVTTAAVLFTIGVPADRLIEPNLRKIAPELRIVDMAEAIEKRAFEGHSAHAGDHAHQSLDPHAWLDPERVSAMASTVRDVLCQIEPKDCGEYSANLETYQADLLAADARIGSLLEPFAGRDVCVFHPAYGYFLDRYGLRQVAVEIEGKEPTARQLGELVERFGGQGVSFIFVQPQFSERSAQTIAEALGAEVIPLDPLAPDHLENLQRMARVIAASLTEEPLRPSGQRAEE